MVQVSRAENVFQIMYLVRVWCLSRLSRVIKNNIARSMEIIHPPTCQFHRAVHRAVERWVPGTSLVHRLLSMENLSQNVDDFFSEGYVSGGAHGLVLNAEQQVRWPDCATPSGALDPPRSQLTSSLHLFPHHLAASPHPPQAIADAPGPHGKPASALRASSLPALVAPCAPPLPLPLARCAPPR